MTDDDIPLKIIIFYLIIILFLLLFPNKVEQKNSIIESNYNDGYLYKPVILHTEITKQLKDVKYFGNGTCVPYVRERTGIKMYGAASTFLQRAEINGYSTSSIPIIGSIVVTSEGGGHVAVVENIINNKIFISEQNYKRLMIISKRYLFIDNKIIKGYIY